MNNKYNYNIFSTTYAESRQKFLSAARVKGLGVESFELDLVGKCGETLATDVVIDGAMNATKMLIVISGVHGVEGFTGSAIQTGLLKSDFLIPENTAVLYVHALNPYGFSYLRRVTQENVDLNRNFVNFSLPLPINSGYSRLHDTLLPESWPPVCESEIESFLEENGSRDLQRAITLGQYSHPDGMWFGGMAPTWSNRTIRKILRKYAPNVEVLASIDIHTGLGQYGHAEKIFASFDNSVFDIAQEWWGELTNVNTGTSTSVPMSGPVQVALTEECKKAVHIGICLEYGTYPLDTMIGAVRADHWAYRYRKNLTDQGMAITAHLKGTFYPYDPVWQRKIWEQADQAFKQALNGLDATS